MPELRHRPLLLTLLLAALLLRGLLPLGGMPVQTGEGGFSIVLCTSKGAVLQAPGADAPLTEAGMDCPYGFALAMGALPVPPAAAVPQPPVHAQPLAPPARSVSLAHRGAHSARGPPVLV